ncbi:MAG: hypothetical protein JNJ58_04890 [Chitinophagaceae bacterium]|nr:hypothetical protein [Chitinophagaceae bacterium]
MIRFIFYVALAYVVMKILRVFIDPFFDRKAPAAAGPANSETKTKPVVGEYVEFEEVK